MAARSLSSKSIAPDDAGLGGEKERLGRKLWKASVGLPPAATATAIPMRKCVDVMVKNNVQKTYERREHEPAKNKNDRGDFCGGPRMQISHFRFC